MKNQEYSTIGKLSAVGLALVTSSVSYSSPINFQKKEEIASSAPKNFISMSYKSTSIDYKDNTNNIIDLSLEKAIKIAKDNAPYSFENINIEHITDLLGKLTTIDVYMSLPKEIDDDLIIQQSKKATNLISNDNYLITYL